MTDELTTIKRLNQWPQGWWAKRALLVVIVFGPTFAVEAVIRRESAIIRTVLAAGCLVQIVFSLRQFASRERRS